MDVTNWLWERVQTGDSPGLLAHALSVAATRDGMLRQAAITGEWTCLASAAEAAATQAHSNGWSRFGPDMVAGICHLVVADEKLRAIPTSDRAATLGGAVRQRWNQPEAIAEALAGLPPLPDEQAEAFQADLLASSHAGLGRDVVEDVQAQLTSDPDLAAYALNTAPLRDALLRATARTGEWEQLLADAEAAAEAARVAGVHTEGPDTTAGVCALMLGDRDRAADLLSAHPDSDLAARAATHWHTPIALAEKLATAAPLDDVTARQIDVNAELGIGLDPDPVMPAPLTPSRSI